MTDLDRLSAEVDRAISDLSCRERSWFHRVMDWIERK